MQPQVPRKQAKGDGRAAKGQHDHYGTCSWPVEKFMDHYGNVAAERKLRTPGSKRRPAGRFVLVGGVHGVGGGGAANDMLWLPSSKRLGSLVACIAAMEV
ncbi:hypothetical protein PR003_g24962 [Phytophthora rubi]|uniref:Uncharacterized protein n=1 Tax=Phytophthora rubi TaxID=129364 RepID=A0A6A4CLX7_9STRA|nr:hypothetical protein PR001_g25406 [Phytophthora rubi]KAE9291697.1 hypothetical protein PR003_g24962 [Phytophthora rubi]